MTTKSNKEKLPLLHPTVMTWIYAAFAVAVIVATVWGFILAGQP